MVVVLILTTMLTLAVPSITSVYREQALQSKLDDFHRLVQRSRWQAIEQQAPTRLLWEKEAIRLAAPLNSEEKSRAKSLDMGPPSLPVAKGEIYRLGKPYAEIQEEEPGWTFWPTGNCEAVVVSYEGPEGSWSLAYDPLNAEYRLESFNLP